MASVSNAAFERCSAIDLKFYDRHLQSNLRVIAKLPNSGRSQYCATGLHVINSDRISGVIPQNNVCPNTARVAVISFVSFKKTLLDIFRTYARNPLRSYASSEIDMNRGSIYPRCPSWNEVNAFHRLRQRFTERFRCVVDC